MLAFDIFPRVSTKTGARKASAYFDPSVFPSGISGSKRVLNKRSVVFGFGDAPFGFLLIGCFGGPTHSGGPHLSTDPLVKGHFWCKDGMTSMLLVLPPFD